MLPFFGHCGMLLSFIAAPTFFVPVLLRRTWKQIGTFWAIEAITAIRGQVIVRCGQRGGEGLSARRVDSHPNR